MPVAQSPEPEAPAQTPQEACARASELIVRNWPAIIEAQVAKAKDGSHLHARYLEEFAGLSGALGSPAATNDESLAALLLRKLQIGTADDESASSNTTPLP